MARQAAHGRRVTQVTPTTTLPTDAALQGGGRHADGATLGWDAVIGEGNGRVAVHPFVWAASDAVAA